MYLPTETEFISLRTGPEWRGLCTRWPWGWMKSLLETEVLLADLEILCVLWNPELWNIFSSNKIYYWSNNFAKAAPVIYVSRSCENLECNLCCNEINMTRNKLVGIDCLSHRTLSIGSYTGPDSILTSSSGFIAKLPGHYSLALQYSTSFYVSEILGRVKL